ncbi:MAG: cation-translocating P-type ATPase C-terminal domain-containing protein, partial [Lewinella sp.]
VQGLAITAGTLLIYRYGVGEGYSENMVRTLVFTVLISANVFLTLVNRSFYYSIFTTVRYRNQLVPLIISITLLTTAVLLYVDPVTRFFEFTSPSLPQLSIGIVAGFSSVIWFEGVKYWKRMSQLT